MTNPERDQLRRDGPIQPAMGAAGAEIRQQQDTSGMSKRIFALVHGEARRRAMQAVADAPEGCVVKVEPPRRSLDQNAAMWPILQAFSEQLEWPVNGRMVKMTPDDWKDVLSAAFKNERARLAMGIDGSVVMLGLRTSKMNKLEFSEFLEFLHATAAERGVSVYGEATA